MKNLNNLFIATALTVSLTGIPAKAGNTDTWQGGTATWAAGYAPAWTAGDTAQFNGSGAVPNAVVNLGATQTASGLIVTGAQTGTVLLEGGSGVAQVLNLDSGGILINSGAGAVTIGSSVQGEVTTDLTNNQSWENDSSSLLTINGAVTNGATSTSLTLTVNGAGSGGTAFGGIISNGAGTSTTALTVNTGTSTGVTTISGANTFTGGFTLTSGTVKVTNSLGLGSIGTAINLNGGELILATNTTSTTAPNPIGGYNTILGGDVTIVSQGLSNTGATNGNGIPYLLGTLTIGNNTLTATASGVTTTTAGRLQFGATTLTGNATLNATGGVLLVVGAGGGSAGLAGNFNLTVESTDGTGTTSVRAGAAGTRTTGTTTFASGTNQINLTNGNVFGAAASLANLPLVLQGGSLDLQSSSSIVIAAYNTSVTGNFKLTNNLAGTAEGLGTLSIGAFTLSTNSSAASGAGNLTFGATTLTGNATFNVNNNNGGTSTATSTLSLASVTDNSGGFSLTKTGVSTLNISGANTFSGGLNDQAGTVRLGAATSVGTGTVTIGSAGNSAILDLNGLTETVAGLATAGTAGSQVIGNGSTTANAVLSYNSTTNSNFGGTIQDAVASGTHTTGVTKTGTGTLTLSGANTYTGATSVTGGTLSVSNIGTAGNIGNATSAVTLSGGGDLSYTGNSASFTRGFTLGTGGGEVDSATSGQTLTIGTAGITGTGFGLTVGGAGNTAITSNITTGAAGTLTKTGAGTLTVSGTNTYTGGTAINGGVLSLGSGIQALGGSGTIATVGAISFGGGTLQYSSANTVDYSSKFSAAGNQAFSVDTNGQTVNFASSLSGNKSSFTLNDTAATAGVLTFSAGNTYNGLTTVKNGELDLNASGAAAVSGDLTAGDGVGQGNSATVKLKTASQIGVNSNVTINSDGDVDLNGFADTVTTLTSNGGNVASSATGGVLTVNATSTFNGTGNVIASGASVINGMGASVASNGGLAVNGSMSGPLSVGTGAALSGTGSVGNVSLAGGNAISSTATLTTSSIQVSGTGNNISGGTVTGNITFNGSSGAPATLNVTGVASGTVNVSTFSTLSGTGTTGAVTLGGASSGINLVKANSTTGTLTVGGLTTSSGGALTFAIGTTAGMIDNINDTGALVIGGSTSIVIDNLDNLGNQTLALGSYTLLNYTGTASGLANLNLADTTLDGDTLSLSLSTAGKLILLVSSSSGVTDTGTDYFNGTGSDLTQASAYDTGLATGTATPSAPSATSNLFFSANRNSATSGTVNSNLEVNSINFGTGGTKSNFGISGTGTITVDATAVNGNTAGSGITIASGGGSATISNAIALGADQSFSPADASSVLTVSGQITGAHQLTKSGAGTVILSNATGNGYTGGTAVTSGRLLVTNTSGSGTGSGAVSVTGSTAILGGSGAIAGPITLSSGGMLYSGATASAVTNGPGTGAVNGTAGGLKLSSALNVNGGTLSFALANQVALSNAGALTTSYISTTGAVNFTGTDAIDLVDTTSGGLSLRMNQAYELISAGSNSAFTGLVTVGANGVLTLDGNGTVLGVWAGGSNALTDYTAITINEFAADGTTVLPDATTADHGYYEPSLILENGDLEVVPEPGTWALMIGGLALLVVVQRRRSKLS